LRPGRFRGLIPFVSAIASLPLIERFSHLIGGLLKDVAAEVPWGWVAIPLIKLFWRRCAA